MTALLDRSLRSMLSVNIRLCILLSKKCSTSEFRNLVGVIASMPKEPKAAKELRLHRMKSKAKDATKPTPAEITLWVLGNGAAGNPKSLYVSTDQSRYLFNCGEGTQRLAHEHKMKLSKLEHVFLTHSDWSNIGGLPGLALTVQDIGVPELCIHGPTNIEQLFEMTKGFMVMENLKITKRNPADKIYVDSCMQVNYIPLFAKQASNSDAAKRRKEDATVVAYVCKVHSKPGQLLLNRCVEMGVPPGPLLGQLKNGRDVTLPNGSIVKSSDVVSPREPGPVFIVLELPSESYLDALVSATDFDRYQLGASAAEDAAKVVVHFSPSAVMEHPLYLQWIARFPASTVHLALNQYSSPESSVAVHRAQHRLHLLSSELFPLLPSQVQTATPSPLSALNVRPGQTLARFCLRPSLGFQSDTVVKIEADAYVRQAYSSPNFPEALSQLRAGIRALDPLPGASYPEVVFLGTASAIPGKERNVSSILVNITDSSSVLLDCGEGTTNQMIRFYGAQAARRILAQLNCVFVSHVHADHHLGLLQLLRERETSLRELGLARVPLTVVGPRFLVPWMGRYDAVLEPVSHLFSYVDSETMLWDRTHAGSEKELCAAWGLDQLSTVLVRHCKHAYGVTLTTREGWKLTYSADTMPCDALVRAGRGSDLLIHEATMEDDLADEAALKTHSTTSQAIDVGRRMGAKFTLLTHFSQRYAKLPLVSESFHGTVGCAFDYMKVRPKDLPALPLLFPALKSIFAEHYQEMCEKTAKKLRQRSTINK